MDKCDTSEKEGFSQEVDLVKHFELGMPMRQPRANIMVAFATVIWDLDR